MTRIQWLEQRLSSLMHQMVTRLAALNWHWMSRATRELVCLQPDPLYLNCVRRNGVAGRLASCIEPLRQDPLRTVQGEARMPRSMCRHMPSLSAGFGQFNVTLHCSSGSCPTAVACNMSILLCRPVQLSSKSTRVCLETACAKHAARISTACRRSVQLLAAGKQYFGHNMAQPDASILM